MIIKAKVQAEEGVYSCALQVQPGRYHERADQG